MVLFPFLNTHPYTHVQYVCVSFVMALETFSIQWDRASLFRTAGPNVIGKELWLRPFSELNITSELRRSYGGGEESLNTPPHSLFHFKGMYRVQYWFTLSITTENHWLVDQFVKTEKSHVMHMIICQIHEVAIRLLSKSYCIKVFILVTFFYANVYYRCCTHIKTSNTQSSHQQMS